jgi:uncharacterized metal-binding protein/predicted Fe-Mo cluster-binding NifX family protein
MRFGIPIHSNRVAPRCVFAEKILLLDLENNRFKREKSIKMERNTPIDLVSLLQENEVETLVCGGISNDTIASIHGLNISVIDNVSSTLDDVRQALLGGTIHPGYGFDFPREVLSQADNRVEKAAADNNEDTTPLQQSGDVVSERDPDFNCLTCRDRICLNGKKCALSPANPMPAPIHNSRRVLDIAAEVALETDPQLCRISELVYFCLDMNYNKLGVPFCHEMIDATRTLVGVLARFFEVLPVSCRIVGHTEQETLDFQGAEEERGFLCNPQVQAEVLNRWGSDLNVLVGLCVGADCIFNQASKAPVTTLFVKDKSLANNPIGALYSHYYLEEITGASRSREYSNKNIRTALK